MLLRALYLVVVTNILEQHASIWTRCRLVILQYISRHLWHWAVQCQTLETSGVR
jgi:hypothetical protein